MLTLNTRQIQALAIAAPGTLAVIDDGFASPRFQLTEDDRIRTGVWSITIDQSGNVTHYFDTRNPRRSMHGEICETTSFADLLQQDADRRLEAMGLA